MTAERNKAEMSRSNRLVGVMMLWNLLMMLTGCENSVVYSRFGNTPMSGWDKTEPVTFDIDSLDAEGDYQMTLMLRISDKYPFRNLQLVVRQQNFPSGVEEVDTVECAVTDEHGNLLGRGVSYYQYEHPVKTLHYHASDSMHIEIHHIMKREILPGIADVGVRVEREK